VLVRNLFRNPYLRSYGVALLTPCLATLLIMALRPALERGIMAPFLATVMLSAWFGGLGPGLVATFLSVGMSAYFFLEPTYSLAVQSLDDIAQLIVFSMVAALISVLNTAHKRAHAALLASRERQNQLYEELKKLQKGYSEAIWTEQRKIAQELQEGIGKDLTGMGFLCKVLTDRLVDPEDHRLAGKLSEGLEGALGQIRGLAHGVCPVELYAEGLMAALARLAASIESVYKVSCQFDCQKPVFVKDNQVGDHLYRLAQEVALSAIKYHRSTEIRIILDEVEDKVELTIRSNGVATETQFVSQEESALRIIRYRAAATGALLRIETTPDRGMRVTCQLPIGELNVRTDAQFDGGLHG